MDDKDIFSEIFAYITSYEDGYDLARTNTKKLLVLNFRVLQLLRVKQLQQELFDMQMRFTLKSIPMDSRSRESSIEKLDETLQRYGNALRNYEFLSRDSLHSIPIGAELFGAPRGLEEYKQAPPKRAIWSLFAKPYRTPEFELTDWQKYTDHPASYYMLNKLDVNESLQFRELDKTGREERAQAQAFIGRFSMAVFGGLSLVGPMLIMTFHPSQETSLIVTSVATMIFAFTVAVFAKDTSARMYWRRQRHMLLYLSSLSGPARAQMEQVRRPEKDSKRYFHAYGKHAVRTFYQVNDLSCLDVNVKRTMPTILARVPTELCGTCLIFDFVCQ